MDRAKWLQFCVYGLVSLIGLALDLTRPDVKSVLCTPFAGNQLGSEQRQTERVK